MKKNKKAIFVSVLIAVVALASLVISINFKKIKRFFIGTPTLKLAYYAESLDDLINESELIITAQVKNEQSELTYSDVDFVKTKVKINEVLKGNINESEITILQTISKQDPTLKKGSTVLLFLFKYSGPVTVNAYVCRGLYQGHYILDGDLIKSSKDYNKNLDKEIKEINKIENLKQRINALTNK